VLKIREVALSDLKPWEENPRLNADAVDAVSRSIEAFGFNVPILCDHEMTIIAGHTRWKAAAQLAMSSVPIIQFHMTRTQRRAFSLADNKTAQLAEWKYAELRDLLEELRAEDIDLDTLGFSDAELREFLEDDAEEENQLPQVRGRPKTRVGDLVILGNHRLFCGNSRDPRVFESLTNGRDVRHVFAGPPCFNQRELGHWEDYAKYIVDMQLIMQNCVERISNGGVLVWHIGNESSTHHDNMAQHSLLLDESGLCYIDTIAWLKTTANYGTPRNIHIQSTRHYYPAIQWEALLVFQKPGKMPKMTREGMEYMSKHHTNVWEIPCVTSQMEDYGHPAVCPVEIPYRCLQAYTSTGDTVFDPFGGSEMTLIAAEKASRQACLVEVNPLYCDVAVKRWESLTGEKAKRDSN